MRRATVTTAILLVGAAALCLRLTGAAGPDPVVGAQIPHLVPGTQGQRMPRDFYVFSWDEFFALNWPSLIGGDGLPRRGAADTKKRPGDMGIPRVWETWKADYELFPNQTGHADPVRPTDWSSWDVPVQPCTSPSSHGASAKVLPMVAKGESVIPGGLNQAMAGPLVDQNGWYVRYEVRVNETEYNETRDKAWYLRNKLSSDPTRPNLFSASTPDHYGAIEIKAAWRLMTPEEIQAQPRRYYMAVSRIVDTTTHKCTDKAFTIGLVGFHIAHKTDTFKAWVWSTFEQVDNVPADGVPAPKLGYGFNDGKTPPNAPLKMWGFSPNGAKVAVDAASLKPEPLPAASKVQTIRLFPIDPEIAALNTQVHQLDGIKGTVWENYELVGAQWQTAFDPIKISSDHPVNGKVEDLYPALKAFPSDAVANTTMETYFQGRNTGKPEDKAVNSRGFATMGTSCMHCHYTAAQWDFSWVLADAAWPPQTAAVPAKK